jgi:hypothetical protein
MFPVMENWRFIFNRKCRRMELEFGNDKARASEKSPIRYLHLYTDGLKKLVKKTKML